jgi:hypothetical protein
MSRNVRFKLSAEELAAVAKFGHDVNLPVDRLAKQCLFLAMQQAYVMADKLAQDGAALSKDPITRKQEVEQLTPVFQAAGMSQTEIEGLLDADSKADAKGFGSANDLSGKVVNEDSKTKPEGTVSAEAATGDSPTVAESGTVDDQVS